MSLLIASVGACSLTPPGDFCLSASQLPMDILTATYLVENNLDLARGIASHNSFGAEVCGWESLGGS